MSPFLCAVVFFFPPGLTERVLVVFNMQIWEPSPSTPQSFPPSKQQPKTDIALYKQTSWVYTLATEAYLRVGLVPSEATSEALLDAAGSADGAQIKAPQHKPRKVGRDSQHKADQQTARDGSPARRNASRAEHQYTLTPASDQHNPNPRKRRMAFELNGSGTMSQSHEVPLNNAIQSSSTINKQSGNTQIINKSRLQMEDWGTDDLNLL